MSTSTFGSAPLRLVIAATLLGTSVAAFAVERPALAAPTPSGSISGGGYADRTGVFRDIDADGVWDAGEAGQAGIEVRAVCVSDDGTSALSYDDTYVSFGPTTTLADGSYSLDTQGDCRIEFTIPALYQGFLQPGVATSSTPAPDVAGSFVQFVDTTVANTTVTTAVINPAEYTGPTSSPTVYAGRNLTGSADPAVNPAAGGFGSIFSLNYDLSGLTQEAVPQAVGAVWGIAVQPGSEAVFLGAVAKRHAGLVAPYGLDAIYAVGDPDGPADWSVPFTAVDTDPTGLIGTDAARGLGDFNDPSDDDAAFTAAGKVGWGDIDISEDGRYIYGVNLATSELVRITISDKSFTTNAIPNPGCTGGSWRPWAVEVNDGLVYVGGVCDGLSSGSVANVAAFAYAFNPTASALPLPGGAALAAGQWSANLIADADPAPGVQMGYSKGCATDTPAGCSWNAWDDTYTDAEFNVPSWAAIKPQPMFTDIEIDDDGSIIAAFSDRTGMQFGYRNRRPQSTNQAANIEGVIGGDVLRLSPPSGPGTFLLESDGVVAQGARLGGGTITGNTTNDEGPGGGEVYSNDDFGGIHFETGLGSLGKVPGRRAFLMGAMDTFDTDSGGIREYPTNPAGEDTASLPAIELYDSTGGSDCDRFPPVTGPCISGFGKGGGLTDLEVAAEFAPVEIGNRVWRDDNANGIQDPDEPGIAGVTVSLEIGGVTQTAVTNAAGEYLFSSIARTGATTHTGLDPTLYRFEATDDRARLFIANATGASQQAPLATLRPTEANDATTNAANVNGNNSNDSDGTVNGTAVEVLFTLGDLGADGDTTQDLSSDTNAGPGDTIRREASNRHIFDFGFVEPVSIGNRVWFDTDNDSTLEAGEQPVAGVTVQLFYDLNGDGTLTGAEQTPVATDITDTNGLYLFSEFTDAAGNPLASPRPLGPGSYVVGIPTSNFAAGGPLAGYLSSGTTMAADGTTSEPVAPDPDTTSNVDDNGTKQTTGFYNGGVLARPIVLEPGDEISGEETGVFDNNIAGVSDDSSNLTVDFGFYRTQVGNVVWLDDGRGGGVADDGLLNGGEVPVAGVEVRLLSADGTQILTGADGILGTADDGTAPVITNASGVYLFSGLPEGTYVVEITTPDGYRSSTDPASGATPLSADSDDNGTGTGNGAVVSEPFTIDAGVAANGNVITNVNGTTANPRVDFGLLAEYDLTIDKRIVSTGPYIAGATVTYELQVTNLGPGVALEGLTVSDRLPTGLSFDTTATTTDESWTCDAPAGQEVTCTWVGDPAVTGEFLDEDDTTTVITINAVIDTPAPTSPPPLVNDAKVEPSPAQTNSETNPLGTTDDGYEDGSPTTGSNNDDSTALNTVVLASLGDVVWTDLDRDGLLDPTEAGIANVTVTLLDADGNPITEDAFGDPITPVLTDSNGRYSFTDLVAGEQYRVQFTLPAGHVWTTSNVDGNVTDARDADATYTANDDSTATTAAFVLSPTPLTDPGDGDWDASPNARNVTNPTIDMGVVPLVSLGDLVWIDSNRNGIFDQTTESPIEDVVVELFQPGTTTPATDAQGDPVAATQTNADGRYEFTNLLPGSYDVRFTLPDGYVWTSSNQGADDSLDADGTYAAITSPFATAAGVQLTPVSPADSDVTGLARPVTNPTIDMGVVPVVSLGDLVWIDLDGDGVFDQATESPLAGVEVVLFDADGTTRAVDVAGVVLPAQSTDADGRYSFENLAEGDYVVRFTLPANYVWTQANVDEATAPSLDSDAEFTANNQQFAFTDVITLTDTPVTDADLSPSARDVTDPTWDAGVVPVLSLGDLVWVDADQDGRYDSGEPPLANVPVRLLNADGTPARDAQGNLVSSTNTGADGRYSFANLLPGDYRVEFTRPAGYQWTDSNVGTDDLDADGLFTTPADAVATTGVITLSPVSPTDSDPGRLSVTNSTVDMGLVPLVAIGDYVWVDNNRDGLQDTGERPLPGVLVSLFFDEDGDGVLETSNANGIDETVAVATDTTDADGLYLFDGRLPGNYQVLFAPPAGYEPTVANSGADRADDSNADPATGRSEIFTVAAVVGGTTVADTDPATVAVLVNPTIDAGYVPVVGAGNYTWIDANGNGLQDAGEPVLPGVTVRLLNPDGTPAVDIDGNPVPDEVTDGGGLYFFDNLAPGSYVAEFVLPAGYGFTVPSAGADSTVDSNPDRATGRTPVFTIGDTVGGETTADSDAETQAVFANLTIDAGVVPIVAVGDYTWLDVNRDGVQDPGEQPLQGVTVRLLDGSGQPALDIRGNPVPPAVTGADGRYLFDNLAPGSYQISFTGPAGYTLSPPGNGTSATDTNPAPATGLTPVFTISGSATGDTAADTDPTTAAVWVNPTIDAGFFQSAALGDRVWFDSDRDGTQDPSELGVPGVTVTLYTASGAAVGTTTTDANGNYRFDNLPPGDYIVEFSNLPPTFGATSVNRGDDGADSDADPITLRTPIISLSAGEVDLTWDLGIVQARQGLPRTGGEIVRMLTVALVAVLVGSALWVVARRRRHSGATS